MKDGDWLLFEDCCYCVIVVLNWHFSYIFVIYILLPFGFRNDANGLLFFYIMVRCFLIDLACWRQNRFTLNYLITLLFCMALNTFCFQNVMLLGLGWSVLWKCVPTQWTAQRPSCAHNLFMHGVFQNMAMLNLMVPIHCKFV